MSTPPPLLPSPRKGDPMIVQAPRLEVENLALEPFSNTFSGMFGGLAFDLDDEKSPDLDRTTCEMSYDIQNYTNLSEWDDDDIDEILVMMPKKFPSTLSTIPEDLEPSPTITHPLTLSDFDILPPPQVQSQFQVTRKSSTTTLCRNRTTGKLLTLKSKRVDSLALCRWPEQLVLECMRDLSSTRAHTPFIPYLHAAFMEGEQMYLVLDPAPTLTLRDLVGRYDGFLAAEAVLFYASEIAMAISALHSAGIMHRDLSPFNVMVDGEGHILLTGFRCAELFGPPRSCSSSGNGLMTELASSESKEYHAPEILLGWTHDSAVDCWGFGMLLYFMFLGTHPFRSGDDVEAEDPHLKAKVLQGSISSEMLCAVEFRARDLILKCLERNPVGRPDIESIKEHAYFSRTSWEVVAAKRSEVPVLPQPIPGRAVIRKKSTFERATSLTPSRSVAWDPNPRASWKTRTIVPQLPEIFRSSMSILPQDKDSGIHVSAVEALALSVEDAGREDEEAAEINSTERRAHFWDTLDREGGLGADEDLSRGSSDVVPQPMKLRRQRSLIYPQQLLASLSTTSLQIQNKLRNRRMTKSKTKSTSGLRQGLLELELDLPVGIEQIGSGIGFTYDLPVVTASSKASICTSAPRTCYGRALRQLGLGLGLGLGFDNSNRNIKRHERTKRTSKVRPREGERQQDSNSNSTSRFLKDMYRCPSWILSTPFSVPSPLALTVANSGSEAADVNSGGDLDLVSPTSDSAEGSLPLSIGSTLTWDSTLDGNFNANATSSGSNLDPTSPCSNSGLTSPGSSSDPTSPASLSQHSDDDTGPFTPTTIACAEEAGVPKSVELAAEGGGHMDVVDVESTLRLVTSSGLRLSFLGA